MRPTLSGVRLMKRSLLGVLVAVLVACSGGSTDGSDSSPLATPAPSSSPNTIAFCMQVQNLRTDSGMLAILVVTGEPGIDEVANRLWDSMEIAAVVAPLDIREDYLAIRATGHRIRTLLEAASYDINQLSGPERNEVSELLESVMEDLSGPIVEWVNDACLGG
jgi:hypothetical protein